MAKKNGRHHIRMSFVIVAVSLAFQAKLNPEVDDPQPLDAMTEMKRLSAADAADYLEKAVSDP